MDIQFLVLKDQESPYPTADKRTVFLIKDSWNDWWDFSTLYHLYFSYKDSVDWIGTLKIGEKNMHPDEAMIVSPNIPTSFNDLPPDFFSIGQDVSYYNNLNNLSSEVRFQILRRLNDIALDENLYEEIKDVYVTKRSLLRSVSSTSVKGQYRRLANGNAKLTDYYFAYYPPNIETKSFFDIKVTPKSMPPTNIHVIIGRNGVGKTHLLNNFIRLLLTNSNQYGEINSEIQAEPSENLFANLVSVSFSSFDTTGEVKNLENENFRYYKIGLLKEENDDVIPKSRSDLYKEFSDSLISLSNSAKTKRWKKAIKTLESDPVFQNMGIEYLIEAEYHNRIESIFDKLSSGHKTVLLTITKLVETVEERSLVILDEPETHLHPPLLSAFTRALSDLLIYRNAVALIATHSPVIVQEVPQSCVWIMNRTNHLVSFDRPDLETFGENIGTLTREIFGLEVTNSGFHSFLKEAIEQYGSYEEIIDNFDGQLGNEAKSILRSLLLHKGRAI